MKHHVKSKLIINIHLIRAKVFKEAADEVASHWNDKLTPEHKRQYEQAQRSAGVLRKMAEKELKETGRFKYDENGRVYFFDNREGLIGVRVVK